MKEVVGNLYGMGGAVNDGRMAELRAVLLPSVTTAEKRALDVVEGVVVYDSTLHKLCIKTNQTTGTTAGWETIVSASA